MPPAQDLLTAASSALASAAGVAAATAPFCATLGASIALQLLFAALLVRSAPFDARAAWKGSATVALLLLPSVASLASILLYLAAKGDVALAGPGATAVAVLPLAIALPVPGVVVWAWWRAHTAGARAAAAALAKAAAAGGAGTGAGAATVQMENPLLLLRSRRTPRRWHRVLHADGNVSFFHALSGESAWEVPGGDEEEVAGVWRRERQPPPRGPFGWRCAATGATAAEDGASPRARSQRTARGCGRRGAGAGWVLVGRSGEGARGHGLPRRRRLKRRQQRQRQRRQRQWRRRRRRP